MVVCEVVLSFKEARSSVENLAVEEVFIVDSSLKEAFVWRVKFGISVEL